MKRLVVIAAVAGLIGLTAILVVPGLRENLPVGPAATSHSVGDSDSR